MKLKICIISFIAALSTTILPQDQSIITSSNKFEIIYLADVQYANNSLWLKKIKDDWKATSINLRIYRSMIEKDESNLIWNDKSYNVDEALNKIADAGLNIYIRINFSNLNNPVLYKKYINDDFHIRSNGKIFFNLYDSNMPLLNITSGRSREGMLEFVSRTVDHLNALPNKIKNRVKLIVTTLSPDDETEFPYAAYDDSSRSIVYNTLTGFSEPEIESFMGYLRKIYGSIDSLNSVWKDGAKFTDFNSDQIRIREYNWDGIKTDPTASDYYKFENGRKDFLDFRREELKRFIDDCGKIVRKAGYKIGVQFGSIYDNLTEFRGFYDPTPLIEKIDQLITDDILEYYPNFDFSADYSRSLCKYWNWKNKNYKSIHFSTETNWPDYGGHSPQELIKYWSLQLRTFYEKGASSLFISHWGTTDSPEGIPEKVISNSLVSYSAWQDTLKKFRNAPVKIITNNFAFNLACEQGLYSGKDSVLQDELLPAFAHNRGFVVGDINKRSIIEFPLNKFSRIKTIDTGQSYNGKGDFVTNYMIQNSPEYLRMKYKKFNLTGTSRYTPESIKLEIAK